MPDPKPAQLPHPTPASPADRLTLFVRKDCHLCAAALQILQPLAHRWQLPLDSKDIDDPATDPLLRAHYDHAVPVLHYNGREITRHRIDPPAVEAAIIFSKVSFCVLAKYPTPGKVKTRLTVGDGAISAAPISAAQAADVHRIFLLHLLRRLTALHPASVVLAFDPPESHDAFATLVSNPAVRLTPQPPGDLGARLVAAHQHATHPTLFLGTDAPDVPFLHLLEAATSLLAQETDAILGPTADGGYWTIGVKPLPQVKLSEVLHAIPWSSGQEFAATVERFGSLGYRCRLVGQWTDVDHPSDLHTLRDKLSRPGVSPDDASLNQSLARSFSGTTLMTDTTLPPQASSPAPASATSPSVTSKAASHPGHATAAAALNTESFLPQSTVLIVDDNPQNVELLHAFLEELPVRIVTAVDGIDALEKVTAHKPDLVLLDIMMPRMSGFQVCRKLKSDETTKDIQVLMVTALNELGDIEQASECGTDDFVSKPVNKFELLTRVKSLLRVRHLKSELERALTYLNEVEQEEETR